jgi:hypothetical protein
MSRPEWSSASKNWISSADRARRFSPANLPWGGFWARFGDRRIYCHGRSAINGKHDIRPTTAKKVIRMRRVTVVRPTKQGSLWPATWIGTTTRVRSDTESLSPGKQRTGDSNSPDRSLLLNRSGSLLNFEDPDSEEFETPIGLHHRSISMPDGITPERYAELIGLPVILGMSPWDPEFEADGIGCSDSGSSGPGSFSITLVRNCEFFGFARSSHLLVRASSFVSRTAVGSPT